jgi:repressor LexA
MLKINSNKSRAIEILGDIEDGENERETINIPIVGTIAAGIPILAVENIEDTISIPMDFIKHKEQLFILKVKGESMIDAGILDEDFAIIEKSDDAENGDIVAVLIGNEATLKRFYKEKDYIRLQPENKTMEPIIVKNCRVMGKLVAVYRGY